MVQSPMMPMPKALRDAHGERLERLLQPQVALTLVYNDIVSLDRCRRDLKKLRNVIDRKLLGSKYYKRQPHERSQFWGVVEALDVFTHIHIGWQMPEPHGIDHFRKILESVWVDFSGKGWYDARDYYGSKWASYACEELPDASFIIESADFLRS